MADHTPATQPTVHVPAPPPWLSGRATTREVIAHAESVVGSRYRIETVAGSGGMGRVFAARDTTTGAPVAIKLLTLAPPQPTDDPEATSPSRAADRLESEARAMASLDHPNLCRVVEVCLDTPAPFLVMQWAGGEPLDRFARRQTVKARVTLLLTVIDAIAAMHDKGVVHGDLKPDNILIQRDATPTIVDFGLATAEADAAPAVHGASPGYAAPERLFSRAPLTPEADVFSLGVLLYELLTGRSPFPPHTAPAVIAGLLERGSVTLPDEIAPDTPADLQKICLAAMEPDPSRRYRDAGALAADIRRYLRRETVAARPSLLTDRLSDEVEAQVARTNEWHRLGMISRRDAENAARVLRALPHAESPWIVDARRLRGSQVALVTGGTLLVLAIIALAGAALPAPLTAALAGAAAVAPYFLGAHLHRSGQKRLGLGMLVTATIALPACVWMIAADTPLAFSDWPRALRTASLPIGAAVLFSAAAFAIGGRVITRTPLFTWLALFTGLPALTLASLADDADPRVPSLALIPVALLTIPFSLALDDRAHGGVLSQAPTRHQRSDAPALLTAALLTLAGALATLALAAPGWTTGDLAATPTPARTAFAFLVNALILAAVVSPITRRATPLARRTAAAARWVLPTHAMLPLVFMDLHPAFGVRTPWLILLLALSAAFIAASALHQWRPFLLAGLAFFALGFVRTLDALSPAGDTALALTALALAGGLLLAAWRAPAWLAKRRLQRWTRAADARPDPHARRTWR